MPIISTDTISEPSKSNDNSYLFPLILVTSLFFLWGLAYGLLDVLNKHFQEALKITRQRSTLLQAAYFGAYFIMALPAGILMKRFGYKKGIITGLLLYAAGAFLFFPSATFQSFGFFLIAVFILATGLTFLETAANPYITILGNKSTSEFRLNLSQSFNGVGAFLGPIIGAKFFFVDSGGAAKLYSVQFVYIFIGIIVLIIAGIFFFVRLPEVRSDNAIGHKNQSSYLWTYKHFRWAVVAQFFYVAAQVGGAALFINYCTEVSADFGNEKASYFLSAGLVLFTIGRFTGTMLMKVVAPNILLAAYAFANILLSLVVTFSPGLIGIYSLAAIFFFNSIMFPTIFALGVKDLGALTKRGSSFIIMSIVGGAIVPYVMGSFTSTPSAYIVLTFCYAVVFVFGVRGYKTGDERPAFSLFKIYLATSAKGQRKKEL